MYKNTYKGDKMVEKTEKSVMKTILKVVSIVAVAGCLLLGVTLSNANKEKKEVSKTLEDNQAKMLLLEEQLKANTISMTDYKKQVEALGVQVVDLNKQTEADKKIIADYAAELEKLKLEQEEIVTSVSSDNLYVLDEEELDFDSSISIDSGDLDKLGDYKIDFDDESIKVEELVVYSGELRSNENKFDGETMYLLDDNQVEYRVVFDEDMTALDYTQDSVEFKFLGEDYTITSWTATSVTFDSISEELLMVGESLEDVTLVKVGDSSVVLSYEGKTYVLGEETKDLGDLEVEVVSIFNDEASSEDLVVLRVAEDLDTTIEDGDEYEADDRYNWKISANSIGLVLDENFNKYNTALKEGDSFGLPDDFVKLSFELSTEDMFDLSVEKTIATGVYEIKGDFEDYSTIYFDGAKFYDDDDFVAENVIDDIRFSDSKRELRVGDFDKLVMKSGVNDDDDIFKFEAKATSDVDPLAGTIISNYDLDDGIISYDVSIPEEDIEVTFKLE